MTKNNLKYDKIGKCDGRTDGQMDRRMDGPTDKASVSATKKCDWRTDILNPWDQFERFFMQICVDLPIWYKSLPIFEKWTKKS